MSYTLHATLDDMSYTLDDMTRSYTLLHETLDGMGYTLHELLLHVA